jgi:glycosyltransferase involved in cell wall biosynthesis
MSKRIGIFLGSAGSNSGGPERYETELVRSLAQIDKVNDYNIFCLFRGGPQKVGVKADNVRYTTLWPAVRPVSMLTTLPAQVWRAGLNLLHATFVPPPLATAPYAFTLVCSSMFEHPEFYPPAIRLRLKVLMGLAVRKARLVVCISRHIQDVIRERFGVGDDRSCVIPLAAGEAFRPIARQESAAFVRQHYGIDTPYLLFSGRWERRKNVARILEAFHEFKQASKAPHRLVLTGERTWAAREAEDVIQRLRMHDEIIDLGKSPVQELPWLYAGADALVYCSLWEGFGMPIVEAMRAGTPVITSNNSSMAEIGADAALLVDPYSVHDMAEAMYRVTLGEPGLGEDLRGRGLVQASRYSWERTARETLASYERV